MTIEHWNYIMRIERAQAPSRYPDRWTLLSHRHICRLSSTRKLGANKTHKLGESHTTHFHATVRCGEISHALWPGARTLYEQTEKKSAASRAHSLCHSICVVHFHSITPLVFSHHFLFSARWKLKVQKSMVQKAFYIASPSEHGKCLGIKMVKDMAGVLQVYFTSIKDLRYAHRI